MAGKGKQKGICGANADTIVARHLIRQVAAGAGKPTEQDIKDYYEKHPELFKERRLSQMHHLKELLGHTRKEVFAGMLLGIAVAILVVQNW